jgi:hypothetical protein
MEEIWPHLDFDYFNLFHPISVTFYILDRKVSGLRKRLNVMGGKVKPNGNGISLIHPIAQLSFYRPSWPVPNYF